ncbi:MAG: PilW family protein [Zoogloeaceae bacterium]|jgi:prepilin-type N-terminal cleavage/methylation domain-containing protein|nr:PilW family protein [Zoogloeaceae bacterium]
MKTIHASRGNWQGGFTLVELMVALVITLFVLAGLFMAFQTNRETFKFNEKLLRIQDSGRFALESIVRDLRMAGDVGCIRSALDQEEDFEALAGKVQVESGVVFNGFSSTSSPTLSEKLVQGLEWDDSTKTLAIYGIPVEGTSTTTLWSDCNVSKVGGALSGAGYQAYTGYRSYRFNTVATPPPPPNIITSPLITNILVGDSSTSGESELLQNVERFVICFGVDRETATSGEMQGKVNQWYSVSSDAIPPVFPVRPLPLDETAKKELLRRTTAVQIQMVVASEPDVGRGTSAQALSSGTALAVNKYSFCDGTKFPPNDITDKRLRKRFSAIATLRNKVPNGYGPNGWLEAQ